MLSFISPQLTQNYMRKRLENTIWAIGTAVAISGSACNLSVYLDGGERDMLESYTPGLLIMASSLIPFALGAGIKIGRKYTPPEKPRSEEDYR